MTGTFGVQGRVASKISKMQQHVASNLPKFFQSKNFKGDLSLGKLHKNYQFYEFLYQLLNLNPKERPSPD